MESNLAKGVIRIDADVAQAKAQLDSLNASLNAITPGASAVNAVMHRLAGGVLQLVQGTTALALNSVAEGFTSIVTSGIEMATTLEKTEVALNTLVGASEDVDAILQQITRDAVRTPFDVEGLALGTQQLTIITKNAAEAERTMLNLGKAVTAGGGGSAELKRMAINMQQIGLNASITQRDIKEFGNAGIDILGLVGEKLGKTRAEAQEYLKDISNPYELLAASLNKAGEAGGRYADIYAEAGGTMAQVTESFKESLGLFSQQVLESSGVLDKAKEAMQGLADAFVDPTFVGTVAESFRRLTDNINAAGVVTTVVQKIQDVLAAFNSGQFNNIVVFFKQFFSTLKQFSGLGFVSNTIKVIMDLFSDNHTAEEVRNVATQLATLVRVLLEFKIIVKVTSYVSSFMSVLQRTVPVISAMVSSLRGMGLGFKGIINSIVAHPFISLAVAIAGVVVAIAALNPDGFNSFIKSIADGVNQVLGFFGDLASGFLTIGQNIITGLWNGLVNGFNAVIGKIQEMGRAIVNAFKSALGIHSPSKVMKDEVGLPIAQGIAAGIRTGYSDIASATEEVKEKLVDLQADWVRELSDFGALDIVESVNVLRQFQQLYASGTKARLEMDKQVHNTEVSITKEIINLVETYNSKFEKAYKSAKEYYNLFEYTQAYLSRDTYSVIEGLQRQNDNLLKYAKNLKAINGMGFNADFLQTIKDQGLDAASEVAGLANATEAEIAEINRLWEERGAVSTDIAVLNTQELKDETLAEIGYLQTGMEKAVIDVYDTGTLLGHNFMSGIYSTMPSVANAALEVAMSAKDGADAVKDTWEGVGDVAEALTAQTDALSAAFDKLELDTFDTVDAFSLFKNILGGIPWYVWAAGAVYFSIQFASLIKTITNTVSMNKAISVIAQYPAMLSVGAKEVTQLADGTTISMRRMTAAYADEMAKMSKNTKVTVTTATGETTKIVQRASAGVTSTVAKASQQTAKATQSASKAASTAVSQASRQMATETQESAKVVATATKKTNMAYSAQGKIGAKILKPFKVFNTYIQGISGSVQQVVVSIGDIISSGINTIGGVIMHGINTIFMWIQGVLIGIMDTIAIFTEGVGNAIRGLIAPLSDGKLLKGVAVLAALAATMVVFGFAALTFAEAGVEGAIALAAFSVGIYAIAQAAVGLGAVSSLIIAGAGAVAALAGALAAFGVALGVAIAAIGVGLNVAAKQLAEASTMAAQLNKDGLVLLLAGIALAGSILSALLPFTTLGALSSVAAMAMSSALVVTGKALAVASTLGASINPQGLLLLADSITYAGLVLTKTLLFAALGAVVGAIATVLSVELVVIAGGLAAASALASAIRLESFTTLADALTSVALALAKAMLFVTLGTVVGAIATVLSVELLAIAGALAGASALASTISIDNLKNLGTALTEVAGQLAGASVIVGLATVATTIATLMSVELLAISGALAGASALGSQINLDNLSNLGTAITTVADQLAGAVVIATFATATTTVATLMSVELMAIAVALAHASAASASIEVSNFDKITQVIEILGSMTSGNFFQNLANAANTSIMAATAESIRNIVVNISIAMQQLALLDGITGGKVEYYRDQVFMIVGTLSQIQAGNYYENLYKKEAVKQLDEMSSSIKSIVQKVSETVQILDDLTQSVTEDTVENYVAQAVRIVEALGGIKLEDGSKGFIKKTTYERVAEDTVAIAKTSGEITKIVEETKKIVDILKEFDSLDEDAIKGYVTQAVDIMKQFGGIELESGDKGWYSANTYEQVSKNTEHIQNTAHHISEMLNSAKNIVAVIRDFNAIGVATVKGYVDTSVEILNQFATVTISQEGTEQTATNSSNVKTTASNVSEILSTTVAIVESLRKLTQEDVSVADVQTYVTNANTIIGYFAAIDVSGDGFNHLEATAKNAEHVKGMAANIKDILVHCQDIVNTMMQFDQAPINGVTNVTKHVGNANTVIQKLASLSLEGSKYEQLAANVGHVRSMVDNVKAILDGARAAATTIDQFVKDFNIDKDDQDNSIAKKVTSINTALTKIAQIKVDDTGLDLAGQAEKLEHIKTMLGKVKEIATAMGQVPQVAADVTTNITNIIKFITDVLAELPTKLAEKNGDFKNAGVAFATNVIDGWKSKFTEVETAAADLQSKFWSTLEGKMQDEFWQGAALAGKVYDGVKSKEPEFEAVARDLQGAFWRSLESKMQDEWYQGQTMANNVVAGLRSPSVKSYYETGQEASQGFANGLNADIWRVNAAVGNLSKEAIKKLRDLLGIASPSKVFAELGSYVTEGFAEGMEANLTTVEETGELIATALLDGYYDNIRPLTASVDTAVAYNKAREEESRISRTPTAGRGDVYITQNNSVYDQLDSSKLISDLAWAVKHA